MGDIALSILVLGVLAMCFGAWLAYKRRDTKRAVLMLVLALVMAANVAIWTMPGPAEQSLAQAAREAD